MNHGDRRRARAAGFTLIELLVALTIFAILAVMAYGGLDVVLKARKNAEAEAERIAELQMTFTLLERDIEQAINRPIRDDFGDSQPSMAGSASALEFTRAGWRNPAGLPRSELERVGYAVDGQELRRLSWGTLDRSQGSEPRTATVIGGVRSFELRYMTPNGEWIAYWPMTAASGQAAALPRAIEVTVETEQWGRIARLFPTPGSELAAATGPTP
jgi:general secretion pathway protein J